VELSTGELVVSLLAAFAGALVQGSIGFGFSLVVTPVLGFIEPTALPGTLLILVMPMTFWMSFRERSDIDMRGFWEIMIGRLPGTAIAVAVVGAVSVEGLSVLIGAAVLFAALLSWFAPEFELRTRWRLLAGLASGFTGTVAALGGPPLAIAYQREPGPRLRSTLALSFVAGGIVSLVALALAGEVESGEVELAIKLVPGLLLGLFAATPLHRFLDKGWLRPAVLIFAGVMGAAAIVRGLL
jgi:uncharacterized protein